MSIKVSKCQCKYYILFMVVIDFFFPFRLCHFYTHFSLHLGPPLVPDETGKVQVPFTEDHYLPRWFFRLLRELGQEAAESGSGGEGGRQGMDRQKALLRFVTGSGSVPIGKFLCIFTSDSYIFLLHSLLFIFLLADGYDPPLCLTFGGNDMATNSLPRAHTCFHQLVLPTYSSFDIMKERIIFAIDNSIGFELT